MTVVNFDPIRNNDDLPEEDSTPAAGIRVILADSQAIYRVGMNIHDDTFLVTVQGAVIDSWSEAALNRGGVGFFTSAAEASRLRWVQVSYQYDILGRLCAYLAPSGPQSAN